MKKLRKLLDGIYRGNLTVLSLLTIRSLEDVYNDLLAGKSSETIQESVFATCMNCGLKGSTKGIGYVIHR